MMGNRRKISAPNLRLGAKGDAVVQSSGMIVDVSAPDVEKTVLKEVPAKAGDIVVGTALIYDDGSVDIIFDSDADPEAVAQIQKLESDMMFGYVAETD